MAEELVGDSKQTPLLAIRQLYGDRHYYEAIAECDRVLNARPGDVQVVELRKQISETLRILEMSPAEQPPPVIQSSRGQPSFNCRVATFPTEKLLCADPALAAAEVAMVSNYRRVSDSLAGQAKSDFQIEQREWVTRWSRTCNGATVRNDQQALRNCVATFLADRTKALRGRYP